MKKGKWSKEEDNLIKNHIKKYGIGRSWQALSNTLGLERCGRSCRSRWLNYLRPGLKHGNFTPAEERLICEMYSKRGSCWSIIASQLPGRTDLAIKNYWNSTLKKRLPAATGRGGAAARRRHRPAPAASTSSNTATAPDVALIAFSEESVTTGSSSSHGGVDIPVSAGSPTSTAQVQEPPPPPPAAANDELIAIAEAPISGPEMIGPKQEMAAPPPLLLPMPLPPSDQTGDGEMDIALGVMSPLHLPFMEPELASITGFDDIDSFLSFFDD